MVIWPHEKMSIKLLPTLFDSTCKAFEKEDWRCPTYLIDAKAKAEERQRPREDF